MRINPNSVDSMCPACVLINYLFEFLLCKNCWLN